MTIGKAVIMLARTYALLRKKGDENRSANGGEGAASYTHLRAHNQPPPATALISATAAAVPKVASITISVITGFNQDCETIAQNATHIILRIVLTSATKQTIVGAISGDYKLC